MNGTKPLKRHFSLQPLSRDHHHSLLLCWKIRIGFLKRVEPVRIKRYSDWFYKNHVKPHFLIEEEYVFPILGKAHVLIKRAIKEHRRLSRLFSDNTDLGKSLSLIEEELENHIRFEERVLFKEIQKVANESELNQINEIHKDEKFVENNKDVFWNEV